MKTEHSFIETFSFGHINETRSLHIFTEKYAIRICDKNSDNININDTFKIEDDK